MKYLFYTLGFLIILFILYPLMQMIFSVSGDILLDTIVDDEVITSILLTLRASLWSTLFALLLGVPLAYILVRFNFPLKKIVEGIVDLPVIIPHSAAGIALLSVWGRKSLFGDLTGFSIMGTEASISIAMFFVSVPFLVNSVKNGFKLIDHRYEKVAITLGASPLRAFITISLPMVKKSILSGSIMMWARGISEFGAVIVVAYHPMTAPILIYDRYEAFGLKYAKPVAVLLILICLLVFIILRIIEDRKKR
ncbi:MAG: ABC transporter permease [Candidatus Delongbacteria bacterium]|nr:ABC transporter permease [Candidatus Delongbacteria bacterium]MBN2835474.1 ABC transporter permease [Candidatus Delongbacteria bacterium]